MHLLDGPLVYEQYAKLADALTDKDILSDSVVIERLVSLVFQNLMLWPDDIVFRKDDDYLDINKSTIKMVFFVRCWLNNVKGGFNKEVLNYLTKLKFFLSNRIEWLPYFPEYKLYSIPLECLYDDEKSFRFFCNSFLDLDYKKYAYLYSDCDRVFRAFVDKLLFVLISNQSVENFNNPSNECVENFQKIEKIVEDYLERKLQYEDGMFLEEIKLIESQLNDTLPKSLVDFYMKFGRVGVPTSDIIISPYSLKYDISREFNVLTFCEENQGLCAWSVLREDKSDDPLVYHMLPTKKSDSDFSNLYRSCDLGYWKHIRKTSQTFSEFMLWMAS